jgi:hypothetical protein
MHEDLAHRPDSLGRTPAKFVGRHGFGESDELLLCGIQVGEQFGFGVVTERASRCRDQQRYAVKIHEILCTTGPRSEVQNGQRLAARGIALAQWGQSFVVTAAATGRWKRFTCFTRRKMQNAMMRKLITVFKNCP